MNKVIPDDVKINPIIILEDGSIIDITDTLEVLRKTFLNKNEVQASNILKEKYEK